MSDWIGIAVIVLVVVGGLFGLSRLSKPYDVSVDEFEKRAREGPSLMSAGLSGLQKFLDPAAEKAIEVSPPDGSRIVETRLRHSVRSACGA